jgi:hypothetical protein
MHTACYYNLALLTSLLLLHLVLKCFPVRVSFASRAAIAHLYFAAQVYHSMLLLALVLIMTRSSFQTLRESIERNQPYCTVMDKIVSPKDFPSSLWDALRPHGKLSNMARCGLPREKHKGATSLAFAGKAVHALSCVSMSQFPIGGLPRPIIHSCSSSLSAGWCH